MGKLRFRERLDGTSLAVQWLRLRTSNAGVTGSIPGWGSKILRAAQRGQKQRETGHGPNLNLDNLTAESRLTILPSNYFYQYQWQTSIVILQVCVLRVRSKV